jgi:hypothetical protein
MAPPFFTSALDGGEWSASRPSRFPPGEGAHGTHWIGGWMGPRACLDVMEKRKILPARESIPGRPACGPSLYRLSYRASYWQSSSCTSFAMSMELSNELTNWPTPWSRTLLEKSKIAHVVKKLPAFYRIWRFSTVFERARHWALSWAGWIQSQPSQPISLRFVAVTLGAKQGKPSSQWADSCHKRCVILFV